MAKSTSSVNPGQVHEILDQLSEDGLLQHSRPSWSLFLSALAAGLEIGFSILLMGVLFSLFENRISEPAMHLLLALSYPLGFLFVIIGREELFTEQTTIAVIPVLARKKGFRSLFVFGELFWEEILSDALFLALYWQLYRWKWK